MRQKRKHIEMKDLPGGPTTNYKRLAELFTAAKVTGGHSHRFRDTFTVGLLEGGVSIENVAKLLGHANIEITQKHYAPWVKSRQDLLEREIWRVYEIGTEF